MSSIKVPITKTDKEGFQVIIDLNLYSEKAITATIYKYTDKPKDKDHEKDKTKPH